MTRAAAIPHKVQAGTTAGAAASQHQRSVNDFSSGVSPTVNGHMNSCLAVESVPTSGS
jgi:hypothetical protein